MTQCPTGDRVDIYLMDVDYGINGYSRGGVTIADDISPPKIPAIYGGDGTTTYGSLTWYEAVDLAAAAGKRLLTYATFTAAAYGVVERQAVGTDPVTTKYQAGHRSACGMEQATGCMWQWGDIKAGAIVPPSNELWSQVKECNTWGDVPIEYTRDYIQTERLKNSIRSEHDALLKETDWIVTKSLEQGVSVPDQWKAYRQALRDITDQAGFPENIEWPEKPTE